ncbi:MAG TPA: TetR/AcrR family transcriptional regulator [Pseudonocardia sp.]|jgi:AcrR family transcriptional regulator|nr:TetR/AcrR family transcriptional regulator [Pseudonocardia sp.]
MPRLSDQTRATRRRHILTSAWGCFSRNGFQATSMDEVIAASGMSSSAVYRYFSGKDELIDATAGEGLALIRDLFARALAEDPVPTASDILTLLVSDVRSHTENPDYDLSRIAIQTWAEAMRRPALREATRQLYLEAREQLTLLARRWQREGCLAENADPRATATVLFTLLPGLIVSHHLVDPIPVEVLNQGIPALADALTSRKVTETETPSST